MHKINLPRLMCVLFITAILLAGAGFSQSVFAKDNLISELGFSGKKVYTAYNLWYEAGKETALWCINYKTGQIIPAGTEVKNVEYTRTVARGAQPIAISFVTVNDNKRYFVNINLRFHPGKTINDYAKLMFTDKNFDKLTDGLNQNEIDSIKKGSLITEMSKRAVLIAYGYPPEHKTSSLENDVWIYWINRFRSKKINFDENGRTIKPPPPPENAL